MVNPFQNLVLGFWEFITNQPLGKMPFQQFNHLGIVGLVFGFGTNFQNSVYAVNHLGLTYLPAILFLFTV